MTLVDILKSTLLRSDTPESELGSRLKGLPSDKNRIILIGGSPRSGTTLLQNIACSATDTSPVLPEAAPVRFVLNEYQHILNHTRKYPGSYFRDEDDLLEWNAGVLETLLDKIRDRHDCEHVILKEPALSPSLPLLHRMLPNAYTIVIVRDPRAVISSMLEWGDRASREGIKHFYQNRDMNELAKYYKSFYAPFLKDNPDLENRMIILRYEDLVKYPERMTGQLNYKLDMDMHADYLPHINGKENVGYADNGAEKYSLTELYGAAVTDKNVDRWKDILEESEVMEIEEHCTGFFTYFKYSKSNA